MRCTYKQHRVSEMVPDCESLGPLRELGANGVRGTVEVNQRIASLPACQLELRIWSFGHNATDGELEGALQSVQRRRLQTLACRTQRREFRLYHHHGWLRGVAGSRGSAHTPRTHTHTSELILLELWNLIWDMKQKASIK